jgi:outer membrane protein TolC
LLIRLLLAGSISLSTVFPVRAQEPTADVDKAVKEAVPIPVDDVGGTAFPVTIDDALELGRRNNTSLRISELLPQQANQDVRGARSIFEPEMFADITADKSADPDRIFTVVGVPTAAVNRTNYTGRFGVRQLVPSGGLFDLAFSPSKFRTSQQNQGVFTQYGSDVTVTYTQPLLRGGWTDYTMSNIHSSEAARAGAELRFQRSIQDVLLSVVQAYWNLVFARGDYVVAVQALELAQAQLDRTNRKIQVGELAPLDRVSDEAEVARRKEGLVTAENQIFDRQDDLRRLLFDDASGELWARNLEPTSPIGEFPASVDLDWRELVRVALRQRPDFRALRADVQIADIQLRAAENEVLPQLDLVGIYTSDGIGRKFPDAFEQTTNADYDDWSVQLQLSIPIGNNGALATRQRARLELERARRVLYSFEIDISLEVRDAVRSLRTLAETIQRGIESERLAQTNLSREIARKEAGTTTSFEVQQRNQELQEARSRLLRNRLDFRIAEANLRYVVGTLGVPSSGESAPDGAGEGKR